VMRAVLVKYPPEAQPSRFEHAKTVRKSVLMVNKIRWDLDLFVVVLFCLFCLIPDLPTKNINSYVNFMLFSFFRFFSMILCFFIFLTLLTFCSIFFLFFFSFFLFVFLFSFFCISETFLYYDGMKYADEVFISGFKYWTSFTTVRKLNNTTGRNLLHFFQETEGKRGLYTELNSANTCSVYFYLVSTFPK